MKKLYVKKLIYMALYVALFFFIYTLSFSVLATAAGFFKIFLVQCLIVYGIPFIIMVVFVYRKRSNNSERRREYLQYMENETKPVLKKEFLFLIKDPHFITEILAFATVIALFLFPIGAGVDGPFYAVFLGGLVIFILVNSIYFLIDFVHWMVVHKNWLKNSRDAFEEL